VTNRAQTKTSVTSYAKDAISLFGTLRDMANIGRIVFQITVTATHTTRHRLSLTCVRHDNRQTIEIRAADFNE